MWKNSIKVDLTLQAAFRALLCWPSENRESTCFDLTKLEFQPTNTPLL